MAGISTVLSVVGAVVGGVMQMQGQQRQQRAAEKAEKARQREFAAQQRIAEARNTREVRDMLRRSRSARAALLNTGAVANTSASSGVQGGVASVGSQAATNLDYFSNIQSAQAQAGQAQVAYGSAMGDMAEAQALGSLGGTIFNTAGGFDTIFGRRQPGGTTS